MYLLGIGVLNSNFVYSRVSVLPKLHFRRFVTVLSITELLFGEVPLTTKISFKLYFDHLFEVTLHQTNIAYIFQVPIVLS